MPKQNKPTHQQAKSTLVSASYTYQGIIPPAHEMERYEQIRPGFADRILKMSEDEGAHRRKMERRIVSLSGLTTTLSQLCALASVGGVLYVCYFAFSEGHPASAATIATGVLASVALAFMRGRNQPKK